MSTQKRLPSNLIYHIGRLENVFINQKLESVNLRMSHAHLLKFVQRHPGCIQKELAQDLTYQAGSLTNILKNLEKRQMIIRKRDPNNGLQKQIFLLPQGEAVLKSVDQAFKELNQLIDQIDPATYHNLLAISNRIDKELNEGMKK
ncbi:DNA-binding MarR family transcriptional regulator [Lactobacillus colini]|uniref:DNA-binding MarR family transcriptional regulator n=1 Tax=Lactobacillus colini TaxID=1819254 RepID=A0ABS4MCV9_9LACO|nr:MarR family transcriptional regulator [Lactobacillus colini]MBP2057520.1 DNA-binding MarR family transcriptional regulator [Lactobacillus colini]